MYHHHDQNYMLQKCLRFTYSAMGTFDNQAPHIWHAISLESLWYEQALQIRIFEEFELDAAGNSTAFDFALLNRYTLSCSIYISVKKQ